MQRSFRSLLRPGLLLLALALTACGQLPPELGSSLEEQSASLTFVVRRDGNTYHAESQTTSSSYSGKLKTVVESAVKELGSNGGNIVFQAGDFDLGADFFKFYDTTDVTFAGQGIDVTILRNNSSASGDTEPFNMTRSTRVTVRDMTVSAGGAARSTSDALDFDAGNEVLIERVKVTSSRGKGIVFDGKDGTQKAEGNVVRDCVITGGVPGDGVHLLASSNNLVEGCTIQDVGGNGITATKSSSSAGQPNKPSNNNVIRNNHVDNAGSDGIRINSSNGNRMVGNTILNSSNISSGRDGIRIQSSDAIACNDNIVELNTATDTQATKTQRYGLRINNSNCQRTVVRGNDFAGNLSGAIDDNGTGTIYSTSSADTEAPTAPTNLTANIVGSEQVNLSWTASTDNVGVTGYEIFRNGSSLARIGNVTSYTDTLLQGGTSYSYQVRARDAAGNWSALSAVASVTMPSTSTLTFNPVADAYVRQDKPNNTYGTASSLDLVGGSNRRHSLLKFNVSGIGTGQVSRVVLRLYNTNSSDKGGDFHRVTNNSWSETNVTWNNAPAYEPTPLASLGNVRSGNWYEVDLSPIISGDGTVSIRITHTSSDTAAYTSKEGTAGFRPELIVTVANP